MCRASCAVVRVRSDHDCATHRLEELCALQGAGGSAEMEIDSESMKMLAQEADEGDDEARRQLASLLVARWGKVFRQSFNSLS